jgi:hypothetical protein
MKNLEYGKKRKRYKRLISCSRKKALSMDQKLGAQGRRFRDSCLHMGGTQSTHAEFCLRCLSKIPRK